MLKPFCRKALEKEPLSGGLFDKNVLAALPLAYFEPGWATRICVLLNYSKILAGSGGLE
jgi:hypothetical protein